MCPLTPHSFDPSLFTSTSFLMYPSPSYRGAHHNNHHEGFMNFMHRDEEVNYFPSRWAQNEGGGGTFPPAPTLASTLAPGMCRFDPVRHADRPPQPAAVLSGRREKQVSDLGWAGVWLGPAAPCCSSLPTRHTRTPLMDNLL